MTEKNKGGRPRKNPKVTEPKRKKIDATVTLSSDGDGRGRWVVRCSKHGIVSRHRYWHNASIAKVNHQAQHRS